MYYEDYDYDNFCEATDFPSSGTKFPVDLNCCGYHGYYATEQCKGKDENDRPVEIDNVPACYKPPINKSEPTIWKAEKFCPENCQLQDEISEARPDNPVVFNFLNDQNTSIIMEETIKGEKVNNTYNHFCFGYHCKHAQSSETKKTGEGWVIFAQVCKCPDVAKEMIKELQDTLKISSQADEPDYCCREKNAIVKELSLIHI